MFGLSFLNPWLLLAALVAFLGVGIGSFEFGARYERGVQAVAIKSANDKLLQEKEERRLEVEGIKESAAERAAELEVQLLTAQSKVRTVVQTITKEVPVYVTKEADARCVVPTGFVSLWNRSTADPGDAGNPAPATEAGVVLDAPSGVALSAVAEAAVANHGAFWKLVAEVKARDAYIATLLNYIEQIRKANK